MRLEGVIKEFNKILINNLATNSLVENTIIFKPYKFNKNVRFFRRCQKYISYLVSRDWWPTFQAIKKAPIDTRT